MLNDLAGCNFFCAHFSQKRHCLYHYLFQVYRQPNFCFSIFFVLFVLVYGRQIFNDLDVQDDKLMLDLAVFLNRLVRPSSNQTDMRERERVAQHPCCFRNRRKELVVRADGLQGS